MDPGFLPDSMGEWLSVIVTICGTISATAALIWRIVKQPLEIELNGLGKRQNLTEQTVTRNQQDISNLQREYEREVFYRTAHAERMSKMELMIDRLEQIVSNQRDSSGREDKVIGERLAAIEAKMQIFEPLTRALESIAKSERERSH
jgi:hypothetical protein